MGIIHTNDTETITLNIIILPSVHFHLPALPLLSPLPCLHLLLPLVRFQFLLPLLRLESSNLPLDLHLLLLRLLPVLPLHLRHLQCHRHLSHHLQDCRHLRCRHHRYHHHHGRHLLKLQCLNIHEQKLNRQENIHWHSGNNLVSMSHP